jgi:sulfur relay (sulfurtransferase) complex TusBCD TusD component (DsrE family)
VRHLHGRARHHGDELVEGAKRGTMDQLTEWTTGADKVLVF